MKGIVGIEKDGIRICITHFPERKKPCLAVKIDNCVTKVASFNSEETADWFIEIIEEMFGEALKELPSADAVEVVRCKDCIHNHEHETPFGSKYHICSINNLAFTQYADFYCAYGERREDGMQKL